MMCQHQHHQEPAQVTEREVVRRPYDTLGPHLVVLGRRWS